MQKVRKVYRVGAAFILLFSIACLFLLLFILLTEPFEFLFIFISLLIVSVIYYASHIVIKGYPPEL